MSTTTTDDKLVHLKPSEILVTEGFNPRSKIEGPAFDQLRESIKQDGVLQPVLVTTNDKGAYVLVAGGRRHAAAVAEKLNSIPALVRESVNGDAKAFAVIENLQRTDLTPIDEAQGFRDAMEGLGCNQAGLAKRLAVSPAHVSERLRLLKLPERIREWIDEGALPAVAGKTLAKIANASEPLAVHVANVCVSGDLDASRLESEIYYAIGQAFEFAGAEGSDLPPIGFAVDLGARASVDDFDFGDDNDAIRERYATLTERYVYNTMRWSETDANAARAFGCLLEIEDKTEWTTRCIQIAFDHDFMLERFLQLLDHTEKEQKKRDDEYAKQNVSVSSSAPESPEHAKERRRNERAAAQKARESAQARNEEIGSQIRLKYHKTPVTAARLEALLIGFVESNDDLASAGLALVDERLIEKETTELKNGTTKTKISVLSRSDAHKALIERIKKARSAEEKLGVVWQAMIAAQHADQGARPDSDRRAWAIPGAWNSEYRNELPREIDKDALAVLPAKERKGVEKRWQDG